MDRQEQIVRLALEAGWTANAISSWRKRGRVPLSARFELARLAEGKGDRLEPRDFDGWRPLRGPRAAGEPCGG